MMKRRRFDGTSGTRVRRVVLHFLLMLLLLVVVLVAVVAVGVVILVVVAVVVRIGEKWRNYFGERGRAGSFDGDGGRGRKKMMTMGGVHDRWEQRCTSWG